MRLLTSIFFCLFICTTLSAQEVLGKLPSQVWHQGSVTLSNGAIESGYIQYDLDDNSIQLSKEGKVLSYTANQMQSFEFFQKGVNQTRNFQSISHESQVKLFELIQEGEASLYAREYVSFSTQTRINENAKHGVGRLHRVRVGSLNYDYFLLNSEGEFIKTDSGRKGIIDAFQDKHDLLLTYARNNKLKFKTLDDMARLTAYYNSID